MAASRLAESINWSHLESVILPEATLAQPQAVYKATLPCYILSSATDTIPSTRRKTLAIEPAERHVVTCFLESDDEILLLRRSQQVGSYRGRWAGVSGYVESTPDEQALTEMREEVGLEQEDVELLKKGKVLRVDDEGLGARWMVHPYLFHVRDRSKIRADWEHTETKWITPRDIGDYPTVPRLKETLEMVYPPLEDK
jgi:8-oxo-dGTP diphosphatase